MAMAQKMLVSVLFLLLASGEGAMLSQRNEKKSEIQSATVPQEEVQEHAAFTEKTTWGGGGILGNMAGGTLVTGTTVQVDGHRRRDGKHSHRRRGTTGDGYRFKATNNVGGKKCKCNWSSAQGKCTSDVRVFALTGTAATESACKKKCFENGDCRMVSGNYHSGASSKCWGCKNHAEVENCGECTGKRYQKMFGCHQQTAGTPGGELDAFCKTCRAYATRTKLDQCTECNVGYRLLDGGGCTAYAGTCENGILYPNTADRTADNQCWLCDYGYSLDSDTGTCTPAQAADEGAIQEDKTIRIDYGDSDEDLCVYFPKEATSGKKPYKFGIGPAHAVSLLSIKNCADLDINKEGLTQNGVDIDQLRHWRYFRGQIESADARALGKCWVPNNGDTWLREQSETKGFASSDGRITMALDDCVAIDCALGNCKGPRFLDFNEVDDDHTQITMSFAKRLYCVEAAFPKKIGTPDDKLFFSRCGQTNFLGATGTSGPGDASSFIGTDGLIQLIGTERCVGWLSGLENSNEGLISKPCSSTKDKASFHWEWWGNKIRIQEPSGSDALDSTMVGEGGRKCWSLLKDMDAYSLTVDSMSMGSCHRVVLSECEDAVEWAVGSTHGLNGVSLRGKLSEESCLQTSQPPLDGDFYTHDDEKMCVGRCTTTFFKP